ncbi:MAG TPA: signal peptidase I [Verrucomicrobiales bacterium]|jgi:signal peptidase I|nr:signal peptidase I [Verrucomicrobiales bacterium]HCL97785.1 signal peptidase I [Verrucomicrobiales bacterium]
MAHASIAIESQLQDVFTLNIKFCLAGCLSVTAIHPSMFSAKWKKEAKLLDKAAKKFLNYKRDLLTEQQIQEITSRREDLQNTWKSNNRDKYTEASKQLQATCENALPRQHSQGWFEENLEVLFVAIVIALGLRTYVVQPFRIPTGSMQPTLNGIVATSMVSTDEFPNMAARQLQRLSHGRNYVDLVLEEDKRLKQDNPIVEAQFMHFFTRTYIYFDDGTRLTFPGPKSALLGYDRHTEKGFGLAEKCGYLQDQSKLPPYITQDKIAQAPFDGTRSKTRAIYLNPTLPAGTVIARGYIDSGDLILVDKVSYHFRRPNRGEVFVFDTRDISYIQSQPNPGSHYIKRLAGTPGDELQIQNNDLYLNGKKATEQGILGVMSKKDGYRGYDPNGRLANQKLFKARSSNIPGMNEYIALGDNSYNSSDSRTWGTVKEFNVIGPAAISLWPFASGHWGAIK